MRSSLVLTGLAVTALAIGSSSAAASGGGGHDDYGDDKVCVVLPTNDDFADEFRAALRRAERRFGVETETVRPASEAEIPGALDSLLGDGDCDMIAGDFLVGLEMEPLLGDYPDQRFVTIDGFFSGDPPNAGYVTFAVDQPSFMAGYAAAALSNTGKVGVYGGMQIEAVTLFMDGFALGIEHFNTEMGADVELLGWDPETETGLFAGTFSDIEIGRQLTEQLYDDGADIVFPVAGALTFGTLQETVARKEAGEDVKMIGVDVDLFELIGGDPDRVILTSVVKDFRLGLFHQIRDLVKDRWEPGVTVEDLDSHGVDLAPWHRARKHVPRWLRQDIRQIERAIKRGDIVTTVDRSPGPLVVGSLLPETGFLSFLGTPMTAGAQLAVEDLNAAGGVFGEPVQLVAGDSGTDPSVAGATVDSLIADDADVIVGAAASSISLAVIDRIVGAGVIQFSPSNTASDFTNYPDDGLYFRTSPSNSLQGEMLAELVRADGSTTVTVVYRDDAYGQSIADAFAAKFTDLGGTAPVLVPYDPGDADFTDELAAIVGASSDAVVLASFDEATQLVELMDGMGIGPAQGNDVWGVDGFIASIGQMTDPAIVTGLRGIEPRVDVASIPGFTDRMDAAIGGSAAPYLYGAETYDAIVVTALAALVAGSDDPARIADEIVGVTRDGEPCTSYASCVGLLDTGVDIDYDGLGGPYEFNGCGEPTIASFAFLAYDGGSSPVEASFVFPTPPNLAPAPYGCASPPPGP